MFSSLPLKVLVWLRIARAPQRELIVVVFSAADAVDTGVLPKHLLCRVTTGCNPLHVSPGCQNLRVQSKRGTLRLLVGRASGRLLVRCLLGTNNRCLPRICGVASRGPTVGALPPSESRQNGC